MDCRLPIDRKDPMKPVLIFTFGVLALAAVMTTPVAGTRKTFVPDWTFKGSALTGWHTLGQAQWTAVNGELVGKPTTPEGGWLVLDKSFQDVEFGADFNCAEGCKTGVLLRAEKTDAGMKGVFVSLDPTEPASVALTIDTAGKEASREPLGRAGGMARYAPGTAPGTPAGGRAGAPAAGGGRPGAPGGGAGRGGARGAGAARAGGPARGPSEVTSIVPHPSEAIKPADWNDLDIVLDATLLRPHVNSSGPIGGGAEVTDELGSYGPIALYVGGTGEVRFRDVSYKDLNLKRFPKETVSANFRMQRLTPFQYSWAQAAADVDHDGNTDIIVPPFAFMGPTFTTAREIIAGQTYNPSTEYPFTMVGFAGDFTGDGWPDFLSTNGGVLYVNPKGEPRRWDVYRGVVSGVTEICVMKDVDGDGKPDLVHASGGTVRYSHPDPANPTGKWIETTISGPQSSGGHGIGAGDINGDGKVDIVNPYGWWEQPAAGPTSGLWKYHPQAFGRWTGRASEGGGEMSIYDVNGDGLADVVTALQAHGFGLAWFEQKKDASGNITFVEHIFADDYASKNAGNVTFSEPHGETAADIDGDGIPDFIVGKRLFSHHESYLDPDGGNGTPVLYVYYTRRNPKAPGGAEFVPELIHNQSGAGSQILAADINKDGAIDVVTSGVEGAYVFFGKPRAKAAPAANKK
jgi:3-keto-disaccharide hydrolase/FG-GAP-like repeat